MSTTTNTLPCPTCSGTATNTFEDRHTGTNKDTCRTCAPYGGEGRIPARTGETPEASFRPTTTCGGGTGAEHAVVPREPTEAMLKAGNDAYAAHEWNAGRAKRGPERESLPIAYRAMLAAAPTPTDRHGVAGGDAGLREALAYTPQMGAAAEVYIKSVALNGEFHLPARFRFSEMWDVMQAAALASTPRQPSPGALGGRDARLREAEQFAAEWYHSPIHDCRRVPSVMAMTAKVVALLEKWTALSQSPPQSPRVSGEREALARFARAGESLAEFPPPGLVDGNLFVACKNEGEGTGWRYVVTHALVSDLHAASAALAPVPPAEMPKDNGRHPPKWSKDGLPLTWKEGSGYYETPQQVFDRGYGRGLADTVIYFEKGRRSHGVLPLEDERLTAISKAWSSNASLSTTDIDYLLTTARVKCASKPAEMAGVEEIAWRPMDTAPHGKQIVARHKPNKHTPHGWIATIVSDFDDPDEHRRGGLDTILHYNGDTLQHGFHGCWLGWMWPEEAAALRTRQDTRPGGAVEGWQPIETAPKEMQPILLVLDNGKHGDISRAPVIGYFRGRQGWTTWHDTRPLYATPTHWMPLPTTPTGTDDGEGR